MIYEIPDTSQIGRNSSEETHRDESSSLLITQEEQATTSLIQSDYGSTNQPRNRPSLRQSFLRSIWISFTINVAVILLSLLMIILLYIDMNTSNVCFEQIKRNGTLPEGTMKWILIGHDIEVIAINLWFQCILIFLFGWRKFMSRHYSTIIVGFCVGCLVAIYKTTLYLVKIDFTKTYYRYPGNFLFLVGVVYSSYLVASKISKINHTVVLTKVQIVIIISTQIFLGFFIAMLYRYIFVQWFNRTKNELYKAAIAMITPALTFIPVKISEYLALKSSSIVKPGRSFVLVYVIQGISLMLYRIMQADVNDMWIFTGLSLIREVFKVFRTATEILFKKFLHRFWQYVGEICPCTRRLGEATPDTDHHRRRLNLDKDIHVMLYESTALILSQAYLALYLITNFHANLWVILKQPILNVSIALGINFFANWLCILIHIHWHKTRLQEVWYKHWKRHVLANVLIGALTIWYFTDVVLSVFRTTPNTESFKLKNCTVPML